MTRQEIQDRISKKEQDIAKIEKRIAKWSKGLRPEDIAICEPFGNCVYGTAPRYMNWREYHGTPEYQEARKNYDAYLEANKGTIPSSEDWNKGPNIGELYSAYRDLGEARETLKKYQNQLTKLDNFDNMEKIPAIWNFLQDWRKSAREFFIENATLYTKLRHNFDDAFEKYLAAQEEQPKNWREKYYLERKFKQEYYEDIHSLTMNITSYSGSVDEKALDKYLDRDVKAKYDNLVNRITEKAGEIQDASGLYIANNGEINGYVIGSDGKVKVETITAGGYNIQIRHYRVLVHKVRE